MWNAIECMFELFTLTEHKLSTLFEEFSIAQSYMNVCFFMHR